MIARWPIVISNPAMWWFRLMARSSWVPFFLVHYHIICNMMQSGLICILVDFGLCADMRFAERRQICGSPYWIPPEMIRQELHTFTCDVWSLAVCILELFTGHPPLHKSAFLCMYTVGTRGLAHLIPENISEQCKDFLKKCFEMDPKIRPSASELLKVLICQIIHSLSGNSFI